jgi:hypothetical protein
MPSSATSEPRSSPRGLKDTVFIKLICLLY